MTKFGRIRGVLAPVVTPFKADLAPDPERLIAHCKWLLSRDSGLAVFGTNSEANSMSRQERMRLLDALVEAGIDPARMMPGTGCCSLSETVQLTAHAVGHGCAGVLMLPPFYYKEVTEDGLFRYFSEVVQRVGDARLRIYLYHIPPVAMVGITPQLVERLLSANPGVIAGMKDSSGNWENTKRFLEEFSAERAGMKDDHPGFDVFVGSETFLLQNLRNGGAGCISGTANVNAEAICAAYAAMQNAVARPETFGHGSQTEVRCEELQSDLNSVRAVFAEKRWPSMIAALKQAIAIYRGDPEWGRVRPPLVEFSAEQAAALKRELERVEFKMRLAPPNA